MSTVMYRSDIIACQSLESCQTLLSVLAGTTFTPDHFNELIHVWMPGVKTIIPPDYFNSLDAAKLTIPSTSAGRFLLYVNETYENSGRVFNVEIAHPDLAYKGTAAYPWLTYAIILASIEARALSYSA